MRLCIMKLTEYRSIRAYSAEDLERFKQGIGTTDWYDEVIRKTAPTTYHNLSVREVQKK